LDGLPETEGALDEIWTTWHNPPQYLLELTVPDRDILYRVAGAKGDPTTGSVYYRSALEARIFLALPFRITNFCPEIAPC
jgi:hypothetical protein